MTTNTREIICSNCNGSGEGQHDGSRCYVCKGSGTQLIQVDPDDELETDLELEETQDDSDCQ